MVRTSTMPRTARRGALREPTWAWIPSGNLRSSQTPLRPSMGIPALRLLLQLRVPELILSTAPFLNIFETALWMRGTFSILGGLRFRLPLHLSGEISLEECWGGLLGRIGHSSLGAMRDYGRRWEQLRSQRYRPT